MGTRIILSVALMLAGIGSGSVAAGHDAHSRGLQWAVVYLATPTLIGSTIVQGPVLFSHDAAKMARGEPCTTIRLLDPRSGPIDEVASFHCLPRPGEPPHRFTLTTRPNVADGFGCVLTAYQFAGDPEVHGVPGANVAH